MYRGWKHSLLFTDLWDLNKNEQAEELMRIWEKHWDPVIKQHLRFHTEDVSS